MRILLRWDVAGAEVLVGFLRENQKELHLYFIHSTYPIAIVTKVAKSSMWRISSRKIGGVRCGDG